MSSSEDYKVQVSISLPPVAQYAKGDMVNFRGETPEEVEALLDAALEGNFFEKAALAAKTYLTATGLLSDAPAQPAQQNEAAQNADNVTSINNSGHFCKHGKRVRRTGTNSRGPWVGYFCPTEKGDPDKCDVEWGN